MEKYTLPLAFVLGAGASSSEESESESELAALSV